MGENNLTEAKRIIKLRKLCQYENAGKSFHYILNLREDRDINRLACDYVKSHPETRAGDLSFKNFSLVTIIVLSHMVHYLNRSFLGDFAFITKP